MSRTCLKSCSVGGEKWPRVVNYCRMMMGTWRIVVLISHFGVYLKFSIIITIKETLMNQTIMNGLPLAPWMVNEVLGVGSEHWMHLLENSWAAWGVWKAGLLGLRKPWFWIEIQCPETWAPENEPWGLQKAEVQASWVRRDWAKAGLCPGQTASAQAACATREEHLAERYGSAPGPSCTLIKQWKSIKDVASSDSQFAGVPGEASSWLAAGQEEGGLQALPSPCLKSTATAQQPGFQPNAN